MKVIVIKIIVNNSENKPLNRRLLWIKTKINELLGMNGGDGNDDYDESNEINTTY